MMLSIYEENFPTSKILISFLFFTMTNLLQVKLWEIMEKNKWEKCDQNPQKYS